MKPNEQETRETFRDYALNTRQIYDGITGPASTLAANLRAAIDRVNREPAARTDGRPLIETDADKRAAISVFIAEVEELLTWDLIGQYRTRESR